MNNTFTRGLVFGLIVGIAGYLVYLEKTDIRPTHQVLTPLPAPVLFPAIEIKKNPYGDMDWDYHYEYKNDGDLIGLQIALDDYVNSIPVFIRTNPGQPALVYNVEDDIIVGQGVALDLWPVMKEWGPVAELVLSGTPEYASILFDHTDRPPGGVAAVAGK